MRKAIGWFLPGLAVLGIDRAVKGLWGDVSAVLIPGVIALRPARNTGMALGLFPGGAGAIVGVSAVLAALAIWLIRGMRPAGLAPVALSMMAGGALGNLIDRLAYGHVIDLFDLLFMKFYVFNVADVGVVAGAVLCGVSLLFRPQDWSRG